MCFHHTTQLAAFVLSLGVWWWSFAHKNPQSLFQSYVLLLIDCLLQRISISKMFHPSRPGPSRRSPLLDLPTLGFSFDSVIPSRSVWERWTSSVKTMVFSAAQEWGASTQAGLLSQLLWQLLEQGPCSLAVALHGARGNQITPASWPWPMASLESQVSLSLSSTWRRKNSLIPIYTNDLII